MKESINQIINLIKSITNRLEHLEERTSDNEYKIFNIKNNVDHAEMVRIHKQNFQELWDNLRRTNLRIIGIEEGAEIQSESTIFLMT